MCVPGARVEEGGGEVSHVYRSSWLAHGVSQSGQVQEDPQEHHDQHDGHSGGGHTASGRRTSLNPFKPA